MGGEQQQGDCQRERMCERILPHTYTSDEAIGIAAQAVQQNPDSTGTRERKNSKEEDDEGGV
jgi:hypothetical protein